MKNTGTGSEVQFEDIFRPLGKKVFIHRITDSKEVRGMAGSGFTKPQPADFVVTVDGQMFYAEVKSTVDQHGFKKSLIKTNQLAAAVQQLAAGGLYYVFIHSLALKRWYMVPAHFILSGAKSWKWAELEQFHIEGV